MVQATSIKLYCHHCQYVWDYKGSNKFYATCPQCHYKVKVQKLDFVECKECGYETPVNLNKRLTKPKFCRNCGIAIVEPRICSLGETPTKEESK